MNRLDTVDKAQLRESVPEFQPGDTVRVHVRIKESETKERLQVFEGVVIARKHGGVRETVTVRKTSFGVGVERIFPLHATGNATHAPLRRPPGERRALPPRARNKKEFQTPGSRFQV